MNPFSIVGLFCEDIRVETGNVFTLVGLIPDNVKVSKSATKTDKHGKITIDQERLLTKLSVYVRANFDPEDPVNTIALKLILPNGEEISLGGGDTEVIERAKNQAREKGAPLAGINMRSIIHPVPMKEPGILRLEAIIDDEVRLLAFLNFKIEDVATSSNASEQPS